ncbi:ClbS/DfsB family four-helix bundle protein [Psychromonas sp. CNPT3]|uniref:ClbS/DfsB family four-helix bundle protein n=1 Tax=Psychromonas sp. CNPT3 TaxID=314282 RepID=UPI00006E487B
MISACDTLAYLIGWMKLALKWHRLKGSGQCVDFPETNYKCNVRGELAQRFYYEYREWNYSDLLAQFKIATTDILFLIDSFNDNELYAVACYEKYTLGKRIQFNTSSPMKNRRTKIRMFKKCYIRR